MMWRTPSRAVLCLLVAGSLHGPCGPGGRLAGQEPDDDNSTLMNGNEEARIAGYLHGDGKYNVLPVPAPLSAGVAPVILARELAGAVEPATVARAARLAILHDLKPSADAFQQLLRRGEPAQRDVGRSVAVISALVWLGDEAQVAAARQRYAELLRRPDIEDVRESLLDAAHALGGAEDAAALQRAISAAATSLRRPASERAPGDPSPLTENLEVRADRLEEFAVRELKALERANRLRDETLAQPDVARRLGNLAALYLEIHPQGTRRLSDWAAFKMVRAKDRGQAAGLFLEAARLHDRQDSTRQKELDLVKARALRAAVYLGATVETEVRVWLGTAPDNGTDLLALRPDWNYPAPHSH